MNIDASQDWNNNILKLYSWSYNLQKKYWSVEDEVRSWEMRSGSPYMWRECVRSNSSGLDKSDEGASTLWKAAKPGIKAQQIISRDVLNEPVIGAV